MDESILTGARVVVSIMEHIPGKRQSHDVSNYLDRRMKETGKDLAAVEEETRELLESLEASSSEVRHIFVEFARTRGLPMFSHDDLTVELSAWRMPKACVWRSFRSASRLRVRRGRNPC
ncbi:hypothetical protein [Phyllobacterium bourgognense]|uniref:Uncharacterized protein n=1 Tax=Phyllobacterium bourgognense TaxID=314236 RepID=A0A368YHS8_9HYPH|nr:hypothetical protein [Phyllobacterium bourgognense]RCW79781.1 hypothetical protein C7476_11635 [Phyllobacterium bourgognense]